MADVAIVRSDLSRIFAVENSAGPANPPRYQGLWRAGAIAEQQGDINLIRVPSSSKRGSFDVINKYTGEPGNPQLDIVARFTMDLSDLLRIVKKQCDVDIQIHFGECGNPQDYKEGWEKVAILENARGNNYTTDQLGALSPDETNMVNETVPFEGEKYYEVKKLGIAQQAATEVTREVVDIAICDSPSCGACGIPSDGTSVVFALMKSGGGSPGILATVLYTKNGGATWGASTVSTLAIGETVRAIDCVGQNTVVLAPTSGGLQYADSSDLANGLNPTWVEVTTGFSASGGPRAIYSANPSYTWIVGAGGYIYFTDDPTNGVSIQDSGSATAQDLNAVDGISILDLVAVGNSNAVVYTSNGGSTWSSVTGPAVGVNLTSVAMRSRSEWMVGTAGGKLYYTRDKGVNWTEKSFPGNGAGTVTDIKFVTNSVGYLTHTNATPSGRLLRTINGGYSWYVLPEGSSALPANAGLNAISVNMDPNVVFVGGVATGGTDGIILKGA